MDLNLKSILDLDVLQRKSEEAIYSCFEPIDVEKSDLPQH
jgi:hypothetical protein